MKAANGMTQRQMTLKDNIKRLPVYTEVTKSPIRHTTEKASGE